MEDNEIIALYWERCETAVAETDRKYGGYCHSISYRILENHDDADECVNDTWIRAWNAMPPHRPEKLSSFLGKITRNLSFNRYRDVTRQKRGGGQMALILEELGECIPGGSCVENSVERLAFGAALNRFLGQLSREDRALFLRRYWYAEPVVEIAASLGMKKSTAKTRLFRLRGKLRELLEQEGIEI